MSNIQKNNECTVVNLAGSWQIFARFNSLHQQPFLYSLRTTLNKHVFSDVGNGSMGLHCRCFTIGVLLVVIVILTHGIKGPMQKYENDHFTYNIYYRLCKVMYFTAFFSNLDRWSYSQSRSTRIQLRLWGTSWLATVSRFVPPAFSRTQRATTGLTPNLSMR